MMTVVNKFVVSGSQFTMTFLREYPVKAKLARSTLGRLTEVSAHDPIGRLCRLRVQRQEDRHDHL